MSSEFEEKLKRFIERARPRVKEQIGITMQARMGASDVINDAVVKLLKKGDVEMNDNRKLWGMLYRLAVEFGPKAAAEAHHAEMRSVSREVAGGNVVDEGKVVRPEEPLKRDYRQPVRDGEASSYYENTEADLLFHGNDPAEAVGLLDIIDSLQKEVWRQAALMKLHGESDDDIAEVLGKAPSTIRRWLTEIEEALRRRLEEPE